MKIQASSIAAIRAAHAGGPASGGVPAFERRPGPPAAAALGRMRRLGRLLVAWARARADEWQRERLARATRRALQALDERTLRDLGFHRGEISGYPDPERRHAVAESFARHGGR